MVGQTTRHCWRPSQEPRNFSRCAYAEFLMETAKFVAIPNQVHACLQSLEPMSSMAALARQRRKPFSHGPIQPFDVGRVEHLPAL